MTTPRRTSGATHLRAVVVPRRDALAIQYVEERWPRPSVFQAGHIPSWRGLCECYRSSPVVAARRWLLLLLSPLLSGASGAGACETIRTWAMTARLPGF